MSVVIDPCNVTNYNRTDRELQVFWIFCMAVAGKNADTAAMKIAAMFSRVLQDTTTPFAYMRQNKHAIRNMLVAHRVGQYHRLTRAIEESLALDLRTCSLADLLGVYGVGPKTARFFLLHTRPDCDYVVLDTHVMKWLGCRLPEFTRRRPSASNYDEIERIALPILRAFFPGVTMADIDLTIWMQQSGRLESTTEEPEVPGVVAE